MPGPKCHFDGEIMKSLEVVETQRVDREEVRSKAVENERKEERWGQVIKTAYLSGFKISGLGGWLSELP